VEAGEGRKEGRGGKKKKKKSRMVRIMGARVELIKNNSE
jgi:hypothetical protein